MFPVGVTTITVVASKYLDVFGQDSILKIRVRPLWGGAQRLIWTATGEPTHNAPHTFTGRGAPVEFEVPVTDQEGWVDGTGTPYQGGAYEALSTVYAKDGQERASWRQIFQPVTADGETFDLDLVPDARAGGEVITVTIPGPPGPIGPRGFQGLDGAAGPAGEPGPALPEDQMSALFVTIDEKMGTSPADFGTININRNPINLIGDDAGSGNLIAGGGTQTGVAAATPNLPPGSTYINAILGENSTGVNTIGGGYDNVIDTNGAGANSIFAGAHHRITDDGIDLTTHGTLGGGSYNAILAGDYNTIVGGTLNTIHEGGSQTILGRQNEISGAGNNTASGILNKIHGTASTAIGSTNEVGNFADPLNPVSVSRGTALGAQNKVTAHEGSALGRGNIVSGVAGFAAGWDNVASGSYSTALGYLNTASGSGSCVLGRDSTASATGATALGRYAVANIPGEVSQSSARFAVSGDAKASRFTVNKKTEDGSANQVLGADGAAATWQMPPDASATFSVLVVARDEDTGDTKSWTITGSVKNDTGVNAAFLGVPTVTVLGAPSAGAAAWTVNVGTGADSVSVRAQGEAAKKIRWVAVVDFVQVIA